MLYRILRIIVFPRLVGLSVGGVIIDRAKLLSTYAMSKSGAVSSDATFLSQAKDTSYASVLKESMVFTIYVHRGGLRENFHHKIVVSSAKHGFVTLELSVYEKRVVPVCQQFHGILKELEWKKEVECTFEDLAEEAIILLRSMGDYFLLGNNCQNFCNYFLKRMGAEQYMTTAEKFAILIAIGVGIWGATKLVSALSSGTSSKK